MKRLGKYDARCFYCGKIIKGAFREEVKEGDDMGTICSDNDHYWHLDCEKRKKGKKGVVKWF